MNRSDLDIQGKLFVILMHNLTFNLLPTHLLKRTYLRLLGVVMGKQSYIHPWVRFTHPARLSLGDNCTINFGCFLDTRGKITIGNNVMIGHHTRIYTAGHDIDDAQLSGYERPVDIGDNVVIFPNVLIMPGVTIGTTAVVYPGSVVVKDVVPHAVVGGNPAQLIRFREVEPQYKLTYKWWFPSA